MLSSSSSPSSPRVRALTTLAIALVALLFAFVVTPAHAANSLAFTAPVRTTIPTTGSFTVQLSYVSDLVVPVTLNVDILNPANSYSFHGKGKVEFNSPASGVATVTVTVTAGTTLSTTASYILNAFMVAMSTYNANPGQAYLSATAVQPTPVNATSAPTVNSLVYTPPEISTIPPSGSFVVSLTYSNALTVPTTLEVAVLNPSNSFSVHAKTAVTVPSATVGTIAVTVPIINGPLSTSTTYRINSFMVASSIYTADPNNAYTQATFLAPRDVTVQLPAPTESTLTYTPVPATIPATGSFAVTLAYANALTVPTTLEVGLLNPSNSYSVHGTTFVSVPAATSGTVTVTVSIVNGPLTTANAYQISSFMVATSTYTTNPSTAYLSASVITRTSVNVQGGVVPAVSSSAAAVVVPPAVSSSAATVVVPPTVSSSAATVVVPPAVSSSAATVVVPPAASSVPSVTGPVTYTPGAGLRRSIGTYSYAEALDKSFLFYEAQRSGRQPATKRIKWRDDANVNDGSDVGVDLSGGLYQGADFVKFSFPQAYTLTMLSWGIINWPTAYERTAQDMYARSTIAWIANYLVKCHTSANELYAQVGDVSADHAVWDRVERMTMARPSVKIDAAKPGSDLAGEAAAALAAASIVFRDVDAAYSTNLLGHARQLFSLANTYRGRYSVSVPAASGAFNSSDYMDELVWAATWLYRATGEASYLSTAQSLYASAGLGARRGAFWDEKSSAASMLLLQVTGSATYRSAVDAFIASVAPNGATPYTADGLVFINGAGSLHYATSAAFVALAYADWVATTQPLSVANNANAVNVSKTFAINQVHYALGDTGFSYVVGFGSSSPQRPHSREASCPAPACTPCGWAVHNANGASANVLAGGLVRGTSTLGGNYVDATWNYETNEPTIHGNAGFTGAVARLVLEL